MVMTFSDSLYSDEIEGSRFYNRYWEFWWLVFCIVFVLFKCQV